MHARDHEAAQAASARSALGATRQCCRLAILLGRLATLLTSLATLLGFTLNESVYPLREYRATPLSRDTCLPTLDRASKRLASLVLASLVLASQTKHRAAAQGMRLARVPDTPPCLAEQKAPYISAKRSYLSPARSPMRVPGARSPS